MGTGSVQNRAGHLMFPALLGLHGNGIGAMLCVLAAAASSETPGHDASAAGFTSLLFVFLLATFIGLGVVTRVSRLLHTPLMSLTNAISAIAVVGSIAIAGEDHPPLIRALGAIALAASMTNIVSGFLITDRMLRMFKKPGAEKRP
jgi:NAD(P) transhydrogenase subunit alpha